MVLLITTTPFHRVQPFNLSVTLAALKEFFTWLAWRPGFKSIIHVPDIDYFSLSIKDCATAKAAKLRDFPSPAVRSVIAAMPVETVIDRRNRALIAFAVLTGMRDLAIVSLSLRHVDLSKSPPLLVRQEPDRVDTKFSKSIITYFFPLGRDLQDIVICWIEELRTEAFVRPE